MRLDVTRRGPPPNLPLSGGGAVFPVARTVLPPERGELEGGQRDFRPAPNPPYPQRRQARRPQRTRHPQRQACLNRSRIYDRGVR